LRVSSRTKSITIPCWRWLNLCQSSSIALSERIVGQREVIQRPPYHVNWRKNLDYTHDEFVRCAGEHPMLRERALKIVLVLVGLLFSAAVYPTIGGLLDPAHSDTGDTMMMGLYATLGIFLLIAVRNPSAHRSLIAFAAWSSFAHAVVMSALGFEIASERTGFLVGSGVLVVIGVALIVLAPGKHSGQRAAAA
jgi:hypothetical protein